MAESRVQEYFLLAYHMGKPDQADLVGSQGVAGQGPFLAVYFSLADQRVKTAHFVTYSCPVAVACGSWLCQWAEGRDHEMLARMEQGDLVTVLGGLPLGKEHCALLAVAALQDALRQWAALPPKGEPI